MDGISIERLNLSKRAINGLNKLGIHTVEQLLDTSLDDILKQKNNIGVKTLNEIKTAMQQTYVMEEESRDFPENAPEETGFSYEQLVEMSLHSIDELHLSCRPNNILHNKGLLTIDRVAVLSDRDFEEMMGLGKKSIDEIKETVDLWIQQNISFSKESPLKRHDKDLELLLRRIASDLEPIFHIYWRNLYNNTVSSLLYKNGQLQDHDRALKTILLLPRFGKEIRSFWDSISNRGVITPDAVSKRFALLNCTFDPSILLDASIEGHILIQHDDLYLLARDTYLEAYAKALSTDDRAAQMLKFRTEGRTLQDIGDLYGLSRERVRQITEKLARSFPPVFEDYFSEPFEYFHLSKYQFINTFPQITEEGFEFLSIRYSRGTKKLSSSSLAGYTGLWKEQLVDLFKEEADREDRNTISGTRLMMRILIENSDNPLSIEDFEKEYRRYILQKNYPEDLLKINVRNVLQRLRNLRSKGIVSNRENKVRYCPVDFQYLWNSLDFSLYKNMVISTDLIYRDYQDLMDELDIRDGYELYYVLKSDLSKEDIEAFHIRFRRIPVIVVGEASEEDQAVKLLKEVSPVSCWDYFSAYEERYGLKRESARGNATITSAVERYYMGGQYRIDATFIDDRDIAPLLEALDKKPLWFIDELEVLFYEICAHSTHDALNAASFKRIGYSLHASYAYKSSYGSAGSFFENFLLKQDILDLAALDKRICYLSVFYTLVEKKKNSLEYIETAPKVLMSLKKVQDVYGLSLSDIKEIQSIVSAYYHLPFFNGHSIWQEIEDLPVIQKLQGNDWLLTCLMKQQGEIASLSVPGGIILSLDKSSLSIGQICEWISSKYGPMPLDTLVKKFNHLFGTQITASKLAKKLKASGSLDKVVLDSIDEYIDRLVEDDISSMDLQDLLQEEF